MPTPIGILGTGAVGRTIAAALNDLGYTVMIGTRDAAATLAKPAANPRAIAFSEWLGKYPGVTLGSFAEAAKFGSIVFNCTNGGGCLAALHLAAAENLNGKTVVDVSNPLDFSNGMPPTLVPQYTNTNSMAEEIQKTFPEAHIVKTLNIVNCDVMVNARKTNGDPTMFVAGNNAKAKDEVKSILAQFGWNDVIDLGDITGARGMEMILPLWLRVYGATKNGFFGWKIVR